MGHPGEQMFQTGNVRVVVRDSVANPPVSWVSAVKSGWCDMRGPWRAWRARKALHAAVLLDGIVDSQLPLLSGLSEPSRRRSASYLAELVLLAQHYRHYAAGWIDKPELERRSRRTMHRLDTFRHRHPSTAQYTEQD